MGVVVEFRPEKRLDAAEIIDGLKMFAGRMDVLRAEMIDFAATLNGNPDHVTAVRGSVARSICQLSDALAYLAEGACEIRCASKNRTD